MALIDPLLVPIRLRGTGLANRIAMSPMTRYHSPGGVPTEEVASYYTRRAASGLGLILTEGVSIPHYAATDDPSVPAMHGETALAAWQQIVDAVHAVGGRIMPQLWHQGVMWQVERPGGDNRSAMRPSGIWGPPDGVISIPADARDAQLAATRPMSDSHIQDIIDAYASAASNAAAIGFDGIAIHGAHGYLIDSFLWDYTNRRTDAWGGNEAARAVFGCAVVRAIRAEIGEELPIILRISQFKMQDYRARLADTPDQLAALLGPLADAGVDLFDGSQRYFDTPLFDDSPLNLAGWAKKLTGKAAMTVGGVALGKSSGSTHHLDTNQASTNNLPALIERFERGEFDMVAVGRAILNDPQWFGRARADEAFLPFDPANMARLA